MVYREAKQTDLEELERMAMNFLKMTPYGMLFPPAEGHVRKLCELVVEHGFALVADPCEPDGNLVGMLGFLLVEMPLTGRLTADEMAWWVEPEHRGGSVGPRLLAVAEQWATTKGATMLKMVAPYGSPVGDFLVKSGYSAVESLFIKPLARPDVREPLSFDADVVGEGVADGGVLHVPKRQKPGGQSNA